MEPEVAARLAEDGLVVLMHLLVAHATRVDGRRVRVLRVEHHRLVGRVHLTTGGGGGQSAAGGGGQSAAGGGDTAPRAGWVQDRRSDRFRNRSQSRPLMAQLYNTDFKGRSAASAQHHVICMKHD